MCVAFYLLGDDSSRLIDDVATSALVYSEEASNAESRNCDILQIVSNFPSSDVF